MAHEITDENFSTEVLGSKSGYVLIDFWAPWCGPCRQFSPILEEYAAEAEDNIKVCKMNIEENTETPTALGIMSIPTIQLYYEGKLIATKVGSLSKSGLQDWVDGQVK
jgi:thioredoxin 1